MPNISITKSGNSIDVDFGDYANVPGIEAISRSYHARNLTEVDLKSDRVNVYMAITHQTWSLTHDENYQGDELLIVDTVDGVNPSSFEALYNAITALTG